MTQDAIQAMIRFGLGASATDTGPEAPAAWLSGQLSGPDPAPLPPDLPSSADGLILLREQQKLRLPGQSLIGPLYNLDVAAHSHALLFSPAPFRERLVWFWANHFTVSIRQGGTAAVVGPYMREAIRPNATGSFFAMLLAVMRHPAMLMYLENDTSVGPNSSVGLKAGRGLNENLARECLELHTLSPAAGYTQQDVTEFAKILTGWSIDRKGTRPGFVFNPAAHEPGDKVLLGRRFPPGEAGGLMALEFLATHPATYRHLATQLCVHFVSDSPSPASVDAIVAALSDSQGDLGQAADAVMKLPEAWSSPLSKFRTPQDFAVAALRLAALPSDQPPYLGSLMAGLGQPLWAAPLPNGWSDQASDWASPDGMMRRIDMGYGIAGHIADRDPMALAQAALGPLLSDATASTIRHAGSRQEALALLFASPEFQRR